MKITNTRQIEQTFVTDIICNKCGNTMLGGVCEPEGLVGVLIDCGYDSKYFGDGFQASFDLCEKCLFELTETFKIKVEDNGGGY